MAEERVQPLKKCLKRKDILRQQDSVYFITESMMTAEYEFYGRDKSPSMTTVLTTPCQIWKFTELHRRKRNININNNGSNLEVHQILLQQVEQSNKN